MMHRIVYNLNRQDDNKIFFECGESVNSLRLVARVLLSFVKDCLCELILVKLLLMVCDFLESEISPSTCSSSKSQSNTSNCSFAVRFISSGQRG